MPSSAPNLPIPFMVSNPANYISDWQFEDVDDKWLICAGLFNVKWLYCPSFNSKSVNLLKDTPMPVNRSDCRWKIYPVEEFKLNKVSYETLPGEEYLTPQTYYMARYPLENFTNYAAERTVVIEENYKFTSSFKQTEGIAISNTVSVSAGFSVQVPIVNISGKVDVVNKTDHTYTFETGETKEYLYKFSQTIKQTVPPQTVIYAWVVGKRYQYNTKYIGDFKGVQSGKIIKLRGDWGGDQIYEVKVTLTDKDGLVLGTLTKDGKLEKPLTKTFIDVNTAMKSVDMYKATMN